MKELFRHSKLNPSAALQSVLLWWPEALESAGIPASHLRRGSRTSSKKVISSKHCFWDIPESILDDLARENLIKPQGSLMDKLKVLLVHVLGARTDAELLELLSQRAFSQKQGMG